MANTVMHCQDMGMGANYHLGLCLAFVSRREMVTQLLGFAKV